MKSQDETLEEWCRALLQAYKLENVQIDVNAVLSLAGVAAHSVVRSKLQSDPSQWSPRAVVAQTSHSRGQSARHAL
ncbi:DUF6457 domain-containing protein [Arthrobacter sp.]|uniref:DUF6457 domain-containing protein n=1 Tax=Arthrobacter sp. TaxID=1667 RepID=UPI00258998FA|nr:DUF6457 domain-containing protein [Arthrobacter sp.]